MWEMEIRHYYNQEEYWTDQEYVVTLKSSFGETQAVIDEIKALLKEQDDNEPLTINPQEIEKLWSEAKTDPTAEYSLNLSTNDYEDPDEDFKGSIIIQLHLSYNIEAAIKRQTAQEDTSKPEQLNLF